MIININELFESVFKEPCLCKVSIIDKYYYKNNIIDTKIVMCKENNVLKINNTYTYNIVIDDNKKYFENANEFYNKIGYYPSYNDNNKHTNISIDDLVNISNNKKRKLIKLIKFYNTNKSSRIARLILLRLFKYSDLKLSNLHGFDGNYFKILSIIPYTQYKRSLVDNRQKRINYNVARIDNKKQLEKLLELDKKLNKKICNLDKIIKIQENYGY